MMQNTTTPTHGNIHCDVTNCRYNTQKSCTATEIKVGPQFAATSADTICSTFIPR